MPGSSRPTTRAAERESVAVVLRRALVRIRAAGWASTHWTRQHEKGLSLSDAINAVKEKSTLTAAYYAKLHLTACLGCQFTEWESVQWRTEAEVLFFLRQAIRVAEGKAFRERAGGWSVTTGPRRAATSTQVVSLKAGVR